jgi:hypothetical protein
LIFDVGEGHPGGAGVLSHQRDDAALAAGEVVLVAAAECFEADDGASDPGVLAGASAGDDGDLAKRRDGGCPDAPYRRDSSRVERDSGSA